jgi:hypothetical protein
MRLRRRRWRQRSSKWLLMTRSGEKRLPPPYSVVFGVAKLARR